MNKKPMFLAGTISLLSLLTLSLLHSPAVYAQQKHGGASSGQLDNTQQRADQESINDLGRLFGFVLRMDREESQLSLSAAQIDNLLRIMNSLRSQQLVSGDVARELTIEIEDKILSPLQLMFTDRLFLQRDENREGTTSGDSAQRGANRGASAATALSNSNPFLDLDRAMGADFLELYEHIRQRE